MENYINSQTAGRAGKPFVIYALVCPVTLEVKYVGQSTDLRGRTEQRTHTKHKGDPVRTWIDSLGGYLRPYRVILERGVNRVVRVRETREGKSGVGRKPRGYRDVWLSSCLETKWIKRFRKTVLNVRAYQLPGVYDALTNPPLPWEVSSE